MRQRTVSVLNLFMSVYWLEVIDRNSQNVMEPLQYRSTGRREGCFYGSVNPQVDFPKLLRLYRRGKLDLDQMVTRTYSIDDTPQAIEDLQKGINARGVVVFE